MRLLLAGELRNINLLIRLFLSRSSQRLNHRSPKVGKTKGPYNPEYEKGAIVEIVDRPTLAKFMSDWTFHNKLESYQLNYAGQVTEVESVGFYHGGDELYKLKSIPGIWHEVNLKPTS